MNRSELLKKYDVPIPRYTSYPTVPYWTDSPTSEEWIDSLRRAFAKTSTSWSLYLHIPFCETLCTFCGCNTIITKGHERELPYIKQILKEFELYLSLVHDLKSRPLKQMHLGGGTPTFLSARHLDELVGTVLSKLNVDRNIFDGSVEVDPRRTKAGQLEALRKHGFKRVSLGVQDFDREVQRLVNRIQPFEMTRDITSIARQLGYESVNFDLIYGLPKQNLESFTRTIERTIDLKPDRIALYSFALVPWIKPQQRLFKDEDLPVGADKRALYEMASDRLCEAGYFEIGMDHFALPKDPLSEALKRAHLHRNFMGYTENRTDVLLGLGVSSISETPDCFHQNEKVLPLFEKKVESGQIATLRGHKLSESDQEHRELILQFMTRGRVTLKSRAQADDVIKFLADMFTDGLVQMANCELILTEQGRPFLRNACVALDERLRQQKPSTRVFSQAL